MVQVTKGQYMRLQLDRSDFRLRTMTWSDMDRVLVWRNQPSVRRVMFTDHRIDSDEHSRWFSRVINDASCSYHVFEYKERPVGILGFFAIDKELRTGEWTFYMAEKGVPRGASMALLFAGIDLFFGSLQMTRIYANIMAWNKASTTLHDRLGFRRAGTKLVRRADGVHDVACLFLDEAEWSQRRSLMFSKLFR